MVGGLPGPLTFGGWHISLSCFTDRFDNLLNFIHQKGLIPLKTYLKNMANTLKSIEADYKKIKLEFQRENHNKVAKEIAKEIKNKLIINAFSFLVEAFKGKMRNDNKTPLVFHSIYLTKLAYMCGLKDIKTLLTIALHDVLEDTNVKESDLMKQDFMKADGNIIENLRLLKEDKYLSREPDGKNLPTRYQEHIKRLIGAPIAVINAEILDRFSDLMDLEYILKLPENERELRLKSKLIKVKSFVENITRKRDDFNKNCLGLFNSKAIEIEKTYWIKVKSAIVA